MTSFPSGPRLPVFSDPTQDLLKAITGEPGISRDELMKRGFITAGLAGDSRLQALLSNGKAIAIDGQYYPWEKQYIELKQRKQPQAQPPSSTALVVYKDPSVIGLPSPAAEKLIEGRSRWKTHSIEVLDKEVEVSSDEQGSPSEIPGPEPIIEAPTSETVSEVHPARPRRSLDAERRCKEAIAQLEASGQPFTRNKIALLAGVGRGYFSANTKMRRVADQAIARCAGKSPGEVDQPMPRAQGKLPDHHQEEPEVLQIAPEPPQAAPDIPEQATTGQGEAEKRLSEVAGAIAAEREKAVKEQDVLMAEIEELTNLYKAAERQQEFCDRLLKTLEVKA